jgi:hypothetical protein
MSVIVSKNFAECCQIPRGEFLLSETSLSMGTFLKLREYGMIKKVKRSGAGKAWIWKASDRLLEEIDHGIQRQNR